MKQKRKGGGEKKSRYSFLPLRISQDVGRREQQKFCGRGRKLNQSLAFISRLTPREERREAETGEAKRRRKKETGADTQEEGERLIAGLDEGRYIYSLGVVGLASGKERHDGECCNLQNMQFVSV